MTPLKKGGGRLVPTDRRQKAEWAIPPGETLGAETDDIVLAEPLPQRDFRLGLRPARVVEKLGRLGEASAVSLIAIAAAGIPDVFPDAVLAEAKRARAPTLGKRTDLRHTPLVTIDGADARDFDDAVYAEPDGDGGFRLVVAIADVSAYVRPGSALDREALKRGNSCYFPDRVVPMLPEALSNGWCSLKPDEDRACLFAEMTVDATGAKTAHRFGRGLMRSAARLTYERVQAERDAGGDGTGLGLPAGLVTTLYDAFAALLAARKRRGTLDLDLPERKVTIGPDGKVAAITPRPRLDSHRLIEEFMVLANVGRRRGDRAPQAAVHLPGARAALARETREPARLPVHARDRAETGGRAPAGRSRGGAAARGRHRAGAAGQRGRAPQPEPGGLRRREYRPFRAQPAGLRAFHQPDPPLCRPGGAPDADRGAQARRGRPRAPVPNPRLPDVAEAVTATERRATLAERDANDRYLAAFMSDQTGSAFAARISGVTRFGLFVTLAQNGASGLLPVSSLPDDFWMHDETSHALIGRRTGAQYRLTDAIDVRLVEANALTGSLVFAPAQGTPRGPAASRTGRKPHR